MSIFLKIIIVPAVIGIFLLITRALEVSKRNKEALATDINSLSPRKLRYVFNVEEVPQNSILDIIESLKDKDLRVSHQNDHEAILYLKNANESKFNGVLNTSPFDMPVRMILQKEGRKLKITLEEDYGFQMFVGPAKAAFSEKYQQAFEFYEKHINQL